MRFFLIVFCLIVAMGCGNKDKRFRIVPPSESGITFQNKLTESVDFNIFNYMYFYNGAGVAVGDVNGDGVIQGLTDDGVGVGDDETCGVGVGLG